MSTFSLFRFFYISIYCNKFKYFYIFLLNSTSTWVPIFAPGIKTLNLLTQDISVITCFKGNQSDLPDLNWVQWMFSVGSFFFLQGQSVLGGRCVEIEFIYHPSSGVCRGVEELLVQVGTLGPCWLLFFLSGPWVCHAAICFRCP